MTVRVLGALTFFLGLAAFETFPLVLRLRTHIPSDLGDPLLNTWILAWDVHALGSGNLRHLFDANIFYPVTNALAFSEHMLGVVPLFASAAMLTGTPLGGYNVVFLLSFALSGFSMFLLVNYWTRAFWPSIVAGTLFGIAPFRLGKIGHLQILNFFWAPLALLCLDHFLRTRRWRSLMGFALFYWLQVLSSVYLAHMVTIAVVLYTGYFVLVVDRTLMGRALALKAMAFVGGSVVVLVPLHLPYLAARRDWGFVRTLDETMTYTPDVLSYLSAPPFMNRLYLALFRPIEQTAGWEKWLFPGLVLPVLAVIGTCGAVAGISAARRRQLRQGFGLIAAAAIVLSLGPYLIAFGVRTGIPMPYLLLYQSIPGFAAMRVPGRFTMLVLCAAVPLAALGVMRCSDAVRRYFPDWGRFAPAVTSGVILTLFFLELGWSALPLVPAPGGTREPEVYRWLAAHRPGPIVELPFGFFEEYQYLYFSTTHWLPLANGNSGFGPPTAGEIREALSGLPAPSAVEYAQALGIRAIVLHTARLHPEGLARWSDLAMARNGLTRVAEFGSDRVYSVPHTPAASSLTAEVPTPGFLQVKKSVRLPLVLRSHDGTWRHPAPQRLSAATIRWIDPRTERVVHENTQSLALPLVIGRRQTVEVPVTITPPEKTGTYTLQVAVPRGGIVADGQVVEVGSSGRPTRGRARGQLEAGDELQGVTETTVVAAGEGIQVRLKARNTGEVPWLASAVAGPHRVELAWRWLEEPQGAEPGQFSGHVALRYDVFPGQSHSFRPTIWVPARPSTYTLELRLVGDGAANLVEPVRVVMNVEPFPGLDFERLLERLKVSTADAPRIALSTEGRRYRAGDTLNLKVTGSNGEHPWFLDAYLVLRGPDGALWMRDGDVLVPYRAGQWPAAARDVQLRARASFSAELKLPLMVTTPGPYTWFLLLTSAGTYRVVAESRVTFEVDR